MNENNISVTFKTSTTNRNTTTGISLTSRQAIAAVTQFNIVAQRCHCRNLPLPPSLLPVDGPFSVHHRILHHNTAPTNQVIVI